MLASVLTWGTVPQECGSTTCQDPETGAAYRQQWGCDKDTPELIFLLDCPRCWGVDPRCKLCKGAGKVAGHRCPYAVVPKGMLRVCEYATWIDTGMWPVDGPLEEQGAWFMQALGIVRNLYARYEELRLKRLAQKT